MTHALPIFAGHFSFRPFEEIAMSYRNSFFILLASLCITGVWMAGCGVSASASRPKSKDVKPPMNMAAVCNGSDAMASQWTLLGPTQMPLHVIGRINAVAALPDEPEIVYAGGAFGGGVFRTRYKAGTVPEWTCITDAQRFKTGAIGDILIDPAFNKKKFHDLYFICELGVFKSIDNGTSWDRVLALNQNPHDRKLWMDSTDHRVIYAMDDREIYLTTNGGNSWQSLEFSSFLSNQTPPLGEELKCIVTSPLNKSVLYATGNGNRIFRFDASLPGALAEKWRDITPALTNGPTPEAHGNTPYRISAAGKMLYVICKNVNQRVMIYTSKDGGYTWDAKQESETQFMGGYFIVSPTQPNVMYLGDEFLSRTRLAYKSVNGGRTFTAVTNYVPSNLYHGVSTHADIRGMKLIRPTTRIDQPNGEDDFVLIGDDGGVLYSTSASAVPVVNWTDLNGKGLSIAQFHGIGGTEKDPGLIVGGVQDNGFLRYEHGTWTNYFLGDGYDCVIDPNDSRQVYGQNISSLSGQLELRQSGDGGITFGIVRSVPSENLSHGMQVLPKSGDFYIGAHNLFKSKTPTLDLSTKSNEKARVTDFSAPPYSVPASIRAGAFEVCEEAGAQAVIYYGFGGTTDAGPLEKKLFKSVDGGVSWADMTAGLLGAQGSGISALAMNPDNTDEVYVGFDGWQESSPGAGRYRVMRSLDGGKSWSDYSEGLATSPTFALKFQRGGNILYIGNWYGVYARRTDDSSSHWECFNKDLPVTAIFDLEINYGAQKIRAGTYGRGLWESRLAPDK